MQLIDYNQFAILRLRDFLPDGAAVAEVFDWEWMGSCWYNESIGFTSFSRHLSMPDQTGGLEISFSELSEEGSQRLLNAIGLPLRPGMSAPEVLSVMGPPAETRQFVPGRRSHEFTLGISQPYFVGCTVDDKEGLIYLTVVLQELLDRDERNA